MQVCWYNFKLAVIYWTKVTLRVAVIMAATAAMIFMYQFMNRTDVSYSASGQVAAAAMAVLPQVEKKVEVPPVMQRIARAESFGSHYCTKEVKARHTKCTDVCVLGQTLVCKNTNGSFDVGKFQINSIHIPAAVALGYDVFKEKDNEAFALYLYANEGTRPWYSSRANW
jgi:hypothetical protein